MSLKPYEEKLKTEVDSSGVYSIGVSKQVPAKGAGLAYVSAPMISKDNLSVAIEPTSRQESTRDHEVFYANGDYLLEKPNGQTGIGSENIRITDEFSIKRITDDDEIIESTPLFNVAYLKYPIILTTEQIQRSISYPYGYETRYLEQILSDSLGISDYSDITPTSDNMVTIQLKVENDGTTAWVNASDQYKIRLTSDSSSGVGHYIIRIYNSFDEDKTYRAVYRAYDGSIVEEIVKSTPIFTKSNDLDSLEGLINEPLNEGETIEDRLMSNIYAAEKSGSMYDIYSPTQLYMINDMMRKPYEFKYRIAANIKARYNKDYKRTLKVGVVYLSNDSISLAKSIGSALASDIETDINEEGSIPKYIDFTNPHPPAEFYKSLNSNDSIDSSEYHLSDRYWELDLSQPQHHINDYDLIIITGYGNHNLSVYNSVLAEYLSQGGNILIDNQSNLTDKVFHVDFGENPIVDYNYVYMEGIPYRIDESKEFNAADEFENKRYTLTGTTPNLFVYMEDSEPVRPQMETADNEDGSWVDIISYTTGKRSICYKTFENRGRVFLSNCGLVSSFITGQREELKKLFVNIVVSIAEEYWAFSPWTYERLYHIDQLFDSESYQYSQEVLPGGKVVAKKILTTEEDENGNLSELSVKDFMTRYHSGSLYDADDSEYYAEAKEFRRSAETLKPEWQPATSIHLNGIGSQSLKAHESIWAYATTPKSGFNIDELIGYSRSDVSIYNEKINFKFTIRPYTYAWKNIITKVFNKDDGLSLNFGEKIKTVSLNVVKVKNTGEEIEYTIPSNYTLHDNNDGIQLNTQLEPGDIIRVEYSNGRIFRQRQYATGENTSQWDGVISRNGDFKIIGKDGEYLQDNLLTNLLPKLPGDTMWADKNNTFFEVKIGYYDFGSFIDDEYRVNIGIFDNYTGDYKYTSDGENIISYYDIFGYRRIENEDGTVALKRKADDIIIDAKTNHYILTANKRRFAVEEIINNTIDIRMSENLNTNENWHPRIKHINFEKRSFDKTDHERLARTIGFKFDKEYIIEKVFEYFADIHEVEMEPLSVSTDSELAAGHGNIVEAKGVKLYEQIGAEYQELDPSTYVVDFISGIFSFDSLPVNNIYADYHYAEFTATSSDQEIEEETVLSAVSKLSGNNYEFTDEDYQILSSAIEIIEGDLSFKYEMMEYYKQPWNPGMPFKRSSNELAKYVDHNTIRVQYPNIHMKSDTFDNSVVREKLERTAPYSYKSSFSNISKTEELILETFDGIMWMVVPASAYEIDFYNGMFIIDKEYPGAENIISLDLYASFVRSTILIEKKEYVNQEVYKEELIRLDRYHYDIARGNILGFDSDNASEWRTSGYKIPVVYEKIGFEEPSVVSVERYEIDYQRGFIRFNYEPSGRIFMDYTFARTTPLTVDDYDDKRGLIKLKEDITFNDNIFATYYYEDDYYEYRGYKEGSRFIKLDLNPTRGHVSTVMTNTNGVTEYRDVPSYELVGKRVYFYLMPHMVKKNGEPTVTNDITIRHTFDKETLSLMQLAHPEMIVLGSIKITNENTVHDIQMMDIRKRGGGLKEEVTEKTIQETDPLSMNMWDIVDFDGLEYHSNGITTIKVPDSVLEKNGGFFTEEEVGEIVQKHLALGIVPIVKYYSEG